MAADLVTIATTAALTQFVGPMFKHLGEQALERAKQIANKAAAQLSTVGREPQPVEPKILLPLVQAASLETDETLSNRWAALLANAADPAQRVQVQPGFAEVLRQLTPMDAQVLAVAAEIETNPESRSPYYTPIALLLPQFAPLTEQQLYVITSNLSRLGLCFNVGRQPIEASEMLAPNPRYNTMGPGVDFIRVTPFGFAFLAAVTPPTA